MASEKPPQKISKEQLDNDKRDVSDLWNDALKEYHGIMGFDLKPKFGSVQEMLDFGTKEMNSFHKFRHDDKKVDKLRSLLASNLDFIEKGSQQLIAAATPAFPPAAAIGTALTYMLSACRQVSADYDVVVVFFEDMNSFLGRIVILEGRLPSSRAYQNSLMDVFTSFLSMCGFATKYIELGRFKKWVSNLMNGEDGALGGARKKMDKNLSRLQNATEFAILGNTEELQKMSRELMENQDAHTRMLEEQRQKMDTLLDTSEAIRTDMQKLLKAFEAQKKENTAASKLDPKGKPGDKHKPASAKSIRNSLPDVDGEISEYVILKETIIADTCQWIFSETDWVAWMKREDGSRPLLAITGPPGSGKSHLAATVYDHFAKLADDDAERHICAAHFYFREQQAGLSTFLSAIVTIVNQIAEHNSQLCEKLFAELSRDDVMVNVWLWKDLLTKLLAPVFSPASKHSLFVALDGIDELKDSERKAFAEFLEEIRARKLKIFVACTTRPQVVETAAHLENVVTLSMTKEKQLPDLKALVWNRLESLSALRRFSRYVKQRISSQVEEAAPNMLYAEHMLKRFNLVGREGAVLQDMERSMPPDLHELYETMLSECKRRTPAGRQDAMATLLRWLAFSFRPLKLDEIVSLLRYTSGDENLDLEEIPEPFSKFLQIGDPSHNDEGKEVPKIQTGWGLGVKDLEKNQEDDKKRIFNDGTLDVKFQERSMGTFFREPPNAESSLRTPASEAHRQIFLVCTQMARPTALLSGRADLLVGGLRSYATVYLLNHWLLINPEEHSVTENAEVMTAFAAIMSNKLAYTRMTEWQVTDYSRKFSNGWDHVFTRASSWVDWMANASDGKLELHLESAAAEWWTEVRGQEARVLVDLAKGHVHNLYKAESVGAALVSYRFAQTAIAQSHLDSLLATQAKKNFPSYAQAKDDAAGNVNDLKRGVLGIAGAFGIEMNSTAHQAVAELLFHYRHFQPALSTCETALASCNDVVERFKILSLMAATQMKLNRNEQAYQSINQCLSGLEPGTAVTPKLKRAALVTKARIEVALEKLDAAAGTYDEARGADPSEMTKGDILEEEFDIYNDAKDYNAIVSIVKKWEPLERLTWMTWDYNDSGFGRHISFQDAAARAGEQAFMVEAYTQTIQYLDNVNAGAPLRIDLASAQLRVCGDLEAARAVLDEVLDSTSTGWNYAFTDEEPYWTLERAVNMQTDHLFEMFCKSSDPVVKNSLLTATKTLTQRPLALAVPPQSATSVLRHRTVISRMIRKMGSATEFQSMMAGVINSALDALSDNVGWNDTKNLVLLADALAHLSDAVPGGDPILRRAALIAVSAQFSQLDPAVNVWAEGDESSESEGSDSEEDSEEDESGDEDDDEKPPTDEGDLGNATNVELSCDGVCDPMTSFYWWGGRTGYQCLDCWNIFLCEPCHKLLQADNRGEQPLQGRRFCGKNHRYLKGPIDGWKGVKGGILSIEGDEPVAFTAWLKDLKEVKCKEAWERFWVGE